MIVCHIESGLGNQMLSYCELLALKKENPGQDFYIETIIYEIEECNGVICQWNGYELERIFNIREKNIKSLFSEKEWNEIINEVKQTEFWKHNWNYPVYITRVLANHGLVLENMRGDFEGEGALLVTEESTSLKTKLRKTRIGYHLKKFETKIRAKNVILTHAERDRVFFKTTGNIFTGQRLCLKCVASGMELIDEQVKRSFSFPPLLDKHNIEFANYLKNNNAIAIHARRGDMLGYNEVYYKYGYFKKCVKYLKKKVVSPVFVFFCDPGSISWCRENENVFGLNMQKDKVLFVDWNKEDESYRDIQLMALCKHAIITNSSFGWWGAYFIENTDKITCSPELWIETTKHF